jgi:hypothetical protein
MTGMNAPAPAPERKAKRAKHTEDEGNRDASSADEELDAPRDIFDAIEPADVDFNGDGDEEQVTDIKPPLPSLASNAAKVIF